MSYSDFDIELALGGHPITQRQYGGKFYLHKHHAKDFGVFLEDDDGGIVANFIAPDNIGVVYKLLPNYSKMLSILWDEQRDNHEEISIEDFRSEVMRWACENHWESESAVVNHLAIHAIEVFTEEFCVNLARSLERAFQFQENDD